MFFSKQVLNSIIKKMAILGVSSVLSISANAFDAEDKAQVKQKIEVIHASAQSLDFEPLVNSMPLKVLQHLSAKTDLSVADLKEFLIVF